MTTEKLQRESDAYVAMTPKSRAMQAEAVKYLPGGSSRTTAYFKPYPFFAERGEGHYVYDVDGNRYLDFMLNATSLVLGHAHPDVVRVIQEQAANGAAFANPTEHQTTLARMLVERVPGMDSVRFTNSGTEGALNAVRAAKAFTGRHKFAKFEGAYHGSGEEMSVSVYPAPAEEDPFAVHEYPGMSPRLLEDVVILPYHDMEASERIIRAHADDLACVVVEPVVAGWGYIRGSQDFLEGLRDLTNELGILLVFDEVQSFRLSQGGAQAEYDVVPDLTFFGKIIGGGTPVGAFGGREEVMALYDPTLPGTKITHGGTFNANPITMAAGVTVLEHMTPEVYDRMNALGEDLRRQLRAVFDEAEIEAQVTGVGSFFGIHFTGEEIDGYGPVARADKTMGSAFFMGLVNEGILVQGRCHGSLSALTTSDEVTALVDAARRVVQRIK